ncbi:MARCKS-related protein-like [Penaeus monodon]|uniref:MARCKS-related protein-like n=1 Tax=Penaeus monodon TaxID=6687 RepID=UPI0018A7AD84|nr:MARCKS-related protein-like [Penaeus monodon]
MSPRDWCCVTWSEMMYTLESSPYLTGEVHSNSVQMERPENKSNSCTGEDEAKIMRRREAEAEGGPLSASPRREAEAEGGPLSASPRREAEAVGGPLSASPRGEAEAEGGPLSASPRREAEAEGGPLSASPTREAEAEGGPRGGCEGQGVR